MPDQASASEDSPRSFKALYIRILLRLLPHLITFLRHPSSAIRSEVDYLPGNYTFQLTVRGTRLGNVYRREKSGSIRRVPPTAVARDVEPGSGLRSADPDAVTIDYVIEFRSISFAFRCFSGGMTLQDALAQRAFATRGPNDTGVSLTYLFTALLRLFFGWRGAYRDTREPSS